MHAIERPYLPRVGLRTLGTVLLAIVVLLLAASRVGGIDANSTSAARGALLGRTAAAGRSGLVGSSWLTNGFASPFHVALPWQR